MCVTPYFNEKYIVTYRRNPGHNFAFNRRLVNRLKLKLPTFDWALNYREASHYPTKAMLMCPNSGPGLGECTSTPSPG